MCHKSAARSCNGATHSSIGIAVSTSIAVSIHKSKASLQSPKPRRNQRRNCKYTVSFNRLNLPSKSVNDGHRKFPAMITYKTGDVVSTCRYFVIAVALVTMNVTMINSSVGQVAVHYPRHLSPYSNPASGCDGPATCVGSKLWQLPAYGGQPTRNLSKTQRLIESNQRNSIVNFSSHWQAPFSVLHDRGGCLPQHVHSTLRPRPRDLLNELAYFKLLPDVRNDRGSYGPNCDGYGYLGSSRSYENFTETAQHYLNLYRTGGH